MDEPGDDTLTRFIRAADHESVGRWAEDMVRVAPNTAPGRTAAAYLEMRRQAIEFRRERDEALDRVAHLEAERDRLEFIVKRWESIAQREAVAGQRAECRACGTVGTLSTQDPG